VRFRSLGMLARRSLGPITDGLARRTGLWVSQESRGVHGCDAVSPCGVPFRDGSLRSRNLRACRPQATKSTRRGKLSRLIPDEIATPLLFLSLWLSVDLAGAQLPAASQGSVRDRSHGAGRVAERARSVRLPFRCNGTDAGHVSDERVPT
jgi:hypothetical protein